MRSIWLSPRAISLHVTVIVLTPTFLALGWWQLHRALSGNELSWAYTFEWPIFAFYGVFMWWRLVHDQDPSVDTDLSDADARPTNVKDQATEEADKRLASYNSYLARLHAADKEEDR